MLGGDGAAYFGMHRCVSGNGADHAKINFDGKIEPARVSPAREYGVDPLEIVMVGM